jgi:hypothetical protein
MCHCTSLHCTSTRALLLPALLSSGRNGKKHCSWVLEPSFWETQRCVSRWAPMSPFETHSINRWALLKVTIKKDRHYFIKLSRWLCCIKCYAITQGLSYWKKNLLSKIVGKHASSPCTPHLMEWKLGSWIKIQPHLIHFPCGGNVWLSSFTTA